MPFSQLHLLSGQIQPYQSSNTYILPFYQSLNSVLLPFWQSPNYILLPFWQSLNIVLLPFYQSLNSKQTQKSHTGLYFKHLYGYILSLKSVKQRSGEFSVKEVYKRSHKEGSNQGSKPRKQATQGSYDNTN